MSNVTIIGVNGLYSDGSTSTSKLLSFFSEKYETVNFNYPILGLKNFLHPESISNIIDDFDIFLSKINSNFKIFICHSYGCYIYYKFIQKYRTTSNNLVFFIAPSLSKTEIITNTFVFYNKKDKILKYLPKILHHFFPYLDCSMGTDGGIFTSNIDCTDLFVCSSFSFDWTFGHSIYFKTDKNIYIMKNIIESKIIEMEKDKNEII